MKFGQYVKIDKIKKKIDEDEKTIKKSRQVKECCGDEYNNVDDDDFEEQTKILHTVMNMTKNLLSSECPVVKTKSLLDIIYLISSYLEDSYKEDDGEKNDGTVFEKKSTVRP